MRKSAAIVFVAAIVVVAIQIGKVSLEPSDAIRTHPESRETQRPTKDSSSGKPPGSDAASLPKAASGSGNTEATTWPEAPEAMESILVTELTNSLAVNIVAIESADCDRTSCKIQYVTTDGASALSPGNSFSKYVAGLRANSAEHIQQLDSGLYSRSLSLGIYPDGARTISVAVVDSAERLLELADGAIASSDYDSGPVVISPWNGGEILVENVCSTDCPLDTQRVIYISVPAGRSCEQMHGIEQRMMVRTQTGSFDERIYCVPNSLVSD